MRHYRCHKTVYATKVVSIDADNRLHCDNGHDYAAPQSAVDRASGGDLGYLVEYEDGYRSWSPSKPFEDGYSLIEG